MGRGWRRPRVPALLARAGWRRAAAIARRRLCLLVAKIQTGGLKFKTGYKDLYSPPGSWPEPTKEKAPTAVRFCDRGSYGGLRLRFAPSQGPLKRNSHTLVPSRFIDNYPSAKENRCDISAISKRARSRRKWGPVSPPPVLAQATTPPPVPSELVGQYPPPLEAHICNPIVEFTHPLSHATLEP